MKTFLLALIFNCILIYSASAQISTDSIPGEYHLEGVMETASALLLKPDSTFEIFFSYGAMDRLGSGKWTVKDGKIILNSRPKPETDFVLVTSKVVQDDFLTIRIVDANPQAMPHMEALVKTEAGEQSGKFNQEGIYQIPKSKVSELALYFNFTPERFSSFPVKSEDNYFEFKIEPWITEIFVQNVTLTLGGEGLAGEHPLLKGNSFSYRKMK
jgi:hypothetical protein